MAQLNSPGIAPLSKLDLAQVNDRITKIRQRLDALGTAQDSDTTAAELAAINAALSRLQRQLAAINTPVAQAGARNLFIQTDPPQSAEPALWIIPVTDVNSAVVDASLVLRTP